MKITISLLLKLFFFCPAVELIAITNSQCKALPPNHELRAIVMFHKLSMDNHRQNMSCVCMVRIQDRV